MKRLLVLVLVVVLLLPSCKSEYPDHFALVTTTAFAVPCMFCSDLKQNICEVVEVDSYGRVLYSVTKNCVFLSEKETILVIMQKYDDKNVFFYEDICYAIEDGCEETKTVLKEQNDWNLPFNESKMSNRKRKSTLDNFLVVDSGEDYKKVLSEWNEGIGKRLIDSSFSDYDGVSHVLYVLVVENETQQKECYFSITDTGTYETKYLKIEDLIDYSEELIAFKQSCGWHYGIKE